MGVHHVILTNCLQIVYKLVDDVIGNTYFPLSFLVQNMENHNFHIQYVDVRMVLEMMNMK